MDFGPTGADYAKHRLGFPASFFDRLEKFGVGVAGQRVLDIGTGTGDIARNLALRQCVVTGLDRSPQMIEHAQKLDAAAGVKVDYKVSMAESTGLPDASFDVLTAGQCWHWFDRPRMSAEVRRLLVPGGTVVIAHFDWLPEISDVVTVTEEIIRKHSNQFGRGITTGVYSAWLADLRKVGFDDVESFSYDVSLSYTRDGWRGRVRASACASVTMPPDVLTAFDAELEAAFAERFPEEPLLIPHRVWAVVAR